MKYIHEKRKKIAKNEYIKPTIRLDDECKNGHQDFSITANITDSFGGWIGGGCCHDDILKAYPEYKIFVDLHLSDYNGYPMHLEANLKYHLKNEPREKVMEIYGITEEEISYIEDGFYAEDSLYFKYILESCGYLERRNKLAKKAIKILEDMTSEKFVFMSTKSNYTRLTKEEYESVEERIDNGYFGVDAIQDRLKIKRLFEKREKILFAEKWASNKINSTLIDLCIERQLIELGYEMDNIIYYKHTNELRFNYNRIQWASYSKTWTEEEFNHVKENLNYRRLPKDIRLTFKKYE
jgi:hypothetical protein